MSEFSPKSPVSSASLLSDFFFNVCFLLLSHPLYFSYFIFFSPYLLKLLSFLSPLFITTFLLLLVLFTVSYSESSSDSKMGFFATTYHVVSETFFRRLRDESEEIRRSFEELEAYKIVFETYTFDTAEYPAEAPEVDVEMDCCPAAFRKDPPTQESSGCRVSEWEYLEKKEAEFTCHISEFLPEKKRDESKPCIKEEEKEVKKVDQGEEKSFPPRRESNATFGEKIKDVKVIAHQNSEHQHQQKQEQETVNAMDNKNQALELNLGSFGSMRREKEWKRTLACKLFEERHNVEGSEGMDLLWETYETESDSKLQAKSRSKREKKGGRVLDVHSVDHQEEEEEEEEEESEGQLCCLQALKFSAGKMNLGMGRPNLVKISKAIKGIGWLHHIGRHGKKGHR